MYDLDKTLIRIKPSLPGIPDWVSLRQLMLTLNQYDTARLDDLDGEVDDLDENLATLSGRVDALETNTIAKVDLSNGEKYTVSATDEFIVITTTDGTDGDIELPTATASGRIISISLQAATNDIDIIPQSGETINLESAGDPITLQPGECVRLIDYQPGKWASV